MTEEYFATLSKLQNGSDIRGVALPTEEQPANLMIAEAIALARGFVSFLDGKTGKDVKDLRIAVGCDSRVTGHYLKRILLDTFKRLGITAYDCGLASTPAMFMSTKFEETACDGAVMITASHLPRPRNGFKFFDGDGGLQKEDIKAIIEAAAEVYEPLPYDEAAKQMQKGVDEFIAATNHRPENYRDGKHTYLPLMDLYTAHLRKLICNGLGWSDPTDRTDEDAQTASLENDRPAAAETGAAADAAPSGPLTGMHIVVDAGNGAGGFYATEVLAPLGADISGSKYLAPNGDFPNHAPNPEDKEAMEDVCETVKYQGLPVDLGLIFDTDVDRSAATTGDGKPIARNGIVALAAALVANDHPGGTVVTDSITSNQLADFLENTLGMVHFRFKRGYKNVINEAIRLTGEGSDAPLAIETSGHCAFSDNYYLDDGAYLATRIVIKAAQLKKEGKSIADLLSALEEPLEAKEFRLPITCEDFSPLGDKVLEDLTEWVRERGGDLMDERLIKDYADDEPWPFTIDEDGILPTLVFPNYEGVRIDFTNLAGIDLEKLMADDGPAVAPKPFGWALLRKSLHDPLMPLNIESDIEGGLGRIKEKLRGFLAQYEDLDISSME